jgi:hypothetical protein
MLKSVLAIAITLSCALPLVGEAAMAAPSRLQSLSHSAAIPQPVPPPCTKCAQLGKLLPGDLVSLNPQPLPPRIAKGAIIWQ